MNKPYHCGFFFKLWDQVSNHWRIIPKIIVIFKQFSNTNKIFFEFKMFDCQYDKACFCAECARAKGERTPEAFKSIDVPDYSKLFSMKLWKDASLTKIEK